MHSICRDALKGNSGFYKKSKFFVSKNRYNDQCYENTHTCTKLGGTSRRGPRHAAKQTAKVSTSRRQLLKKRKRVRGKPLIEVAFKFSRWMHNCTVVQKSHFGSASMRLLKSLILLASNSLLKSINRRDYPRHFNVLCSTMRFSCITNPHAFTLSPI